MKNSLSSDKSEIHHPAMLHRKASIGISERFKNVEESCSSSAIYLIWVLSKRALFPAKQYWAINKVMYLMMEKQTSVFLQQKI